MALENKEDLWILLTSLDTVVQKDQEQKTEEDKLETELENENDLWLQLAREMLQKSLAANEAWKKKSDPDVLQMLDLDGEPAVLFAQEATPWTKNFIGQYSPSRFPPCWDLKTHFSLT